MPVPEHRCNFRGKITVINFKSIMKGKSKVTATFKCPTIAASVLLAIDNGSRAFTITLSSHNGLAMLELVYFRNTFEVSANSVGLASDGTEQT